MFIFNVDIDTAAAIKILNIKRSTKVKSNIINNISAFYKNIFDFTNIIGKLH